jgi:hypothetical protein
MLATVRSRTRAGTSAVASSVPYRRSPSPAPTVLTRRTYARSLGYTTGRWPLVPLVGKVVTDNLGLLEAYEVHHAFTSATAAAQVIQGFRDSMTLDPQAHALDPSLFGPSWTAAVRSVLGSNHGRHEVVIQVIEPLGPHVVELSFQGGAGLTAAAVAPLARTVASTFTAACPTTAASQPGGLARASMSEPAA